MGCCLSVPCGGVIPGEHYTSEMNLYYACHQAFGQGGRYLALEKTRPVLDLMDSSWLLLAT